MIQIFLTNTYKSQLSKIEDYIFSINSSIHDVENFLVKHNKLIDFIKLNYSTASSHPQTGDQSWPFADGRYRVFYKSVEEKDNVKVYLLDIIDNKQLNLKIYPTNTPPTYNED